MSFRFENRSQKKTKKNEKKKTQKKIAVVCNFGILSNWIQKREKPTRIKSKNEKNDRKKRTNTKQIENTSKKERKSSFFRNNFWCLPDLTQFDNFSSSQKGPQQLWRLFSMSEDPGDRGLLVKISMMIHMNTQKQLSKQPKTLR